MFRSPLRALGLHFGFITIPPPAPVESHIDPDPQPALNIVFRRSVCGIEDSPQQAAGNALATLAHTPPEGGKALPGRPGTIKSGLGRAMTLEGCCRFPARRAMKTNHPTGWRTL